MSWTYTAPPFTAKDKVRFWTGDTTQTEFSATDEEILFLLGENEQDVFRTASQIARRIGDRYSEKGSGGSKSVGPLSLSAPDYLSRAAVWYAKADRLMSGNPDGDVSIVGGMFTGGPVPVFEIGQQDNGRRQTTQDGHRRLYPFNG